METDAPLDYALFQLSPRRQRCELVVSGNGRMEKIASGSVKPFVAHLRAAEEQAAAQPPPPAIRLQLERRAAWFSKGTLERFVRFVSTPEVLEMANTFDLEMSQLEGARKIYAQGGSGDAASGGPDEVTASAAAADITKKELLRAIDVRLSALKQDLATACSRASSAGFNPNNVSELLLFANHFGANRLSEACSKFMSLCQRRPDISPQNAPLALSSHWKGFDDGNIRGSSSSDMSIDEPQVDLGGSSDKSTVGGSDSQVHRLKSSQGSVPAASEPVTEQQPKPTTQQAVDKQETETDASPTPAVGGLVRRLSVKDRISMFESQKKEQTPSSSNSNSNSAGASKVVPGKGEHRRVPSGASMEKLVRRWSNVSDMSIDLSNNDSSSLNEKKEDGTFVGTPTSTDLEGNSKLRADKDSSGLADSVTSQSWSQKDGMSMGSTSTNTCSPSISNDAPAPHKQTKSRAEDDMVVNTSFENDSSFGKEQGVIHGRDTKVSDHAVPNFSTRNRIKTSPKLVEDASLKHKDILTSSSPEEHIRMVDKEVTAVVHEMVGSSEQIGPNDTRGPRLHTKDIHTEADMVEKKDRPARTFEKISGGVKPKLKTPSSSRVNPRGSSGRGEITSIEIEGHDVSLQRNRLPNKADNMGRKVISGSDSDCSGRQGTSLNRQSSNAEQELNLQPKVARPAKGNQDRHGELQMKANELEKLYAAHKLTSSRRGKSTDVQVDNTPVVTEVKPVPVLPEKIYTKKIVKESITTSEFDENELLKMVNYQGYDNVPQNFGILSLEESRGKFYDQYMQKRDAKLKEDWKLQREEKEAMLKAMHESLERSKAELQAKFSQSVDASDSAYVSRSQKIPPLKSTRKNKDQGVDAFFIEEELNSDYQSGDGSSRSADSRKHFSHKVVSAQKASVPPVHKRSSRTVSSGYANRRNPPENPLAQSVPNFSDFRKENTRPAPGLSRATARGQQKSFARSKSIIEEPKSILKEDQSRRSQSMRKSQIPDELKDISSVNEDIYNWDPSRMSKNQSEGTFGYNTRRTGPPKAFLRKGNGTHPAVSIAGFQAAMMANAYQNGSSGDFEDQQDDSPDDAKEEEEEYESIEENLRESDFPADSESENPRESHDFGNSDDPGSENGDVNFPSEAPGLVDAKFGAFAGTMHDSTGDLPSPWSSRLPQLFPYANDTSDGDAFADSPSGSPSPWNSHSLDEITDADVSRMRRKWGSAQMPFVAANASQQTRKDASKGLKKLWKFGRKNRGGDGLVNDWVSASTASECEDDMEDGRDLVVGSSDDYRKSRMGYLASYDGFVENEGFAEQEQSLRSSIPNPPANFRLREDQLTGSSLKAPRSFFSLSTFRSKGADARLR